MAVSFLYVLRMAANQNRRSLAFDFQCLAGEHDCGFRTGADDSSSTRLKDRPSAKLQCLSGGNPPCVFCIHMPWLDGGLKSFGLLTTTYINSAFGYHRAIGLLSHPIRIEHSMA